MRDLLDGQPVDPATLIDDVRSVPPIAVGDEVIRDFIGALASTLLRPATTRRFPEIASLGFFLRAGELRRLAAVASEVPIPGLRVPRGLIFHIPPANVDTIFVYSWAISALCGNSNVVRVSNRSSGAALVIIDELRRHLATADPVIRASQRFVSMERDDPGFDTLSGSCDMRVIWGGDQAIEAIRRHDLGPFGTELVFPDRFSMVALGVEAVAALDDQRLKLLAQAFMNDAWWFDQAACSSPRAVVWVGAERVVAQARPRFLDAVERELVLRGWGADGSMSVQRRVAAYGMALSSDEQAALDFSRPRFALSKFTDFRSRGWFGAGGFVETAVDELNDLAPLLERKDQTLTHFGIGEEDLYALARSLGGRGLDRLVPVGEALQFERVWDGHDLLAAFTRCVTIRMADRRSATSSAGVPVTTSPVLNS